MLKMTISLYQEWYYDLNEKFNFEINLYVLFIESSINRNSI